MHLCDLQLRGFRNYEESAVRLDTGVNLILGDNAQGKTNLLEAVTYLSMGRSFRTRKEAELIGFGQDFAELSAKVFSHDREKELRAVIFASRRPRQLFLSGVRQKTFGENLAGQLNTVLFCPEDLLVLRAGASARRRLLDDALCQLRPGYEAVLTEYGRVLEHKSRILKDWREDRSLLDLLPDFNDRLCFLGARLISARGAYLMALAREAARYHREFSGDREALTTQYKTVSTISDPLHETVQHEADLRLHMQTHARAELESGQCLSGPHRDDFEVFFNGLSLKSYGSQGQTRTAAISLKLAERELMFRDSGQMPVLLLDDVLSELDAGRQDFLLNHLSRGQVLMTACEKDRHTALGRVIRVEQGRILED